MRKFLVCLIVTMGFATSVVAQSSTRALADSPPESHAVILRPCAENLSIFCIKEITVEDTNLGKSVIAKITGRNRAVDKIGNGGLHVVGSVAEYESPGISYEGENNQKFIPTFEYTPAITVPCPIVSCSPARDVLGINIKPSDFNQPWQKRIVTSPFKSDNKLCSSNVGPDFCWRDLRFPDGIKFHIKLNVGKNFQLSFVHADASDFSYTQQKINSNGDQELDLNFQPVNYSYILSYPTFTLNNNGEQIADATINAVNIWLFGKDDMWAKSIGPCSGTGAFGVVNNAVVMLEPKWDYQDQTLSVNLNAPHLNEDGTVQVGYFQAFVSFDMAKCLWNLDLSNKVSARITSTYADGQTPQIVASVSKIENGIFYLTVSGFHYSSPTLHVHLSQAVNQAELPVSPDTAMKSKNSTVTCRKGKVVRKVIGVNPVCPPGYSKIK